ncbi:MAG: tryptophan synthase subunit alpha [Miltoncostaeaceae bacterium]
MSDGPRRIAAAFAVDRPLFIPYVMGGYPDVQMSLRHAEALAPHADILELGIPFSDPLADGPTIQAAGQTALEAGTRPADVLDIAARVGTSGPPVVVMTYANILLAAGPRAFLERAAAAGVAGLIIPDLPLDEAGEIREQARRAGVALVPLVAPTTADERLAAVGRAGEGFVYCVSVTGVTGGQVQVDDALSGFLARARAAIELPLVVGFGIRTAEQVMAIGEIADGAVIASHLIRIADEAGGGAAGTRAIESYAAGIADVLRSAPARSS